MALAGVIPPDMALNATGSKAVAPKSAKEERRKK